MTTSLFPVPTVATGGMTLLSTTTHNGSSGLSVTISSIPQTYKQLKVHINISGGVGGPVSTNMTFSGATSNTSYSTTYFYLYASSGTGSGAASAGYGLSQLSAYLPGVSSGNLYIDIPDYASTTIAKNFSYFCHTSYISSTSNVGSGYWSGVNFIPGAITSIGLTFGSNFYTSSVATIKIWGIN